MKLSAFSVFMFLLILEVNSQNVLSDLLESINNKDAGSVQDGPDELDAVLEDTRMKLIRLMRRSPAEKNVESWPGRWFPEAVTEPQRRKVSPTNIDDTKSSGESWTGRWLPERITDRPLPKPNRVMTGNNMWQMINTTCDDGHTNLTVDWDFSPVNYTCYNPAHMFYPDPNVRGIIERDHIPAAYSARHVCMSSTIDYYNTVPTFGPHRPAWPKYGEYRFVPRQRWIHNLEHGAVVMLYHPCAHPLLVQKLRKIVKNCLYRHIITPYTFLSHDRPLALVTWGWAYLMPEVDVDTTIKFIQEHALKGPEHTHNDGQYSEMLLEHAEVVSSIDDNDLCPIHRFQK